MTRTVPPKDANSTSVFVSPFVGSTNPFVMIKSNEDNVWESGIDSEVSMFTDALLDSYTRFKLFVSLEKRSWVR